MAEIAARRVMASRRALSDGYVQLNWGVSPSLMRCNDFSGAVLLYPAKRRPQCDRLRGVTRSIRHSSGGTMNLDRKRGAAQIRVLAKLLTTLAIALLVASPFDLAIGDGQLTTSHVMSARTSVDTESPAGDLASDDVALVGCYQDQKCMNDCADSLQTCNKAHTASSQQCEGSYRVCRRSCLRGQNCPSR